ncbi:MAG: nucleotidyl transferase AbiEii/AbiGii toxin family protein, partial [Candidatus Brocadiae bacterium]|nr:nucleotidyl transferase AbiEii/AbiGii toxin family protein [Candidatus Brocadiia bacterium]
PAGGGTEMGLVNVYHLMYQVVHYDLPTLLAGKLHALCFRPYAKGRDLYDLFWFVSSRRGLEPNVRFLNNAAAQTEVHPPVVRREPPPLFDQGNWRSIVLDRLQQMDMDRAREEMRPFLERGEEADLLTLDNFRRLLRA